MVSVCRVWVPGPLSYFLHSCYVLVTILGLVYFPTSLRRWNCVEYDFFYVSGWKCLLAAHRVREDCEFIGFPAFPINWV